MMSSEVSGNNHEFSHKYDFLITNSSCSITRAVSTGAFKRSKVTGNCGSEKAETKADKRTSLPDWVSRVGLAKRGDAALRGLATPKKVPPNIEARSLEIRPATTHDDDDHLPALIPIRHNGALCVPRDSLSINHDDHGLFPPVSRRWFLDTVNADGFVLGVI